MKKRSLSIISLLLLLATLIASLVACGEPDEEQPEGNVHVDYVAETKLDMNDTSTLKQEVTLKRHIDGDTTHFNVPTTFDPTGVAKARYLCVDTPESTGSIQEWGKTASNFTKERVSSATSIIIESDKNIWEQDGNGRYLVWVWYKTASDTEYRNLNIEILQAGLAVGNDVTEGKYAPTAVKAIAQATDEKLYIHSDDIDPNYHYGDASTVTLKELRVNVRNYLDKKVSFEGVVTHNSDYTVYVEDYDDSTGMYFGIQVFYGYMSNLHSVLAQGNRVRITGTVTEFSGTYQVSGLTYLPMRPNEPDNVKIISKGNSPAFPETTAAQFTGTKDLEIESVLCYEASDTCTWAQFTLADGTAVTALEAGVAYKLTLKNNMSTVYLTSDIEDGVFGTTVVPTDAAEFYVEAGEGSGEYRLYFMNGTVKTYVVIGDEAEGADTATEQSGATVFKWRDDLGTLVVAKITNNRAIGAKATLDYETLAVSTSISMKNLVVKSIYTTTNASSDDKGAMTLTCMVDGIEITVRTGVLKDADGNIITESYFRNKTIDVKGIVDYFDLDNSGDGTYQIKAFTLSDITVH